MLLVPLLIVLSYFIAKKDTSAAQKSAIKIPWFAVGFILVAGFNSFNLLPQNVVHTINVADTFLLTMAMTALGVETTVVKFKTVGGKPFLLAFLMFLWLIGAGWLTTYFIG